MVEVDENQGQGVAGTGSASAIRGLRVPTPAVEAGHRSLSAAVFGVGSRRQRELVRSAYSSSGFPQAAPHGASGVNIDPDVEQSAGADFLET